MKIDPGREADRKIKMRLCELLGLDPNRTINISANSTTSHDMVELRWEGVYFMQSEQFQDLLHEARQGSDE